MPYGQLAGVESLRITRLVQFSLLAANKTGSPDHLKILQPKYYHLMRLDRNANPDGKGKYALIKLRVDDIRHRIKIPNLVTAAVLVDAIDLGDKPETEFFVIRLKDKNAANALMAYSVSCKQDDPEFSREIHALAMRAGQYQPKQQPT